MERLNDQKVNPLAEKELILNSDLLVRKFLSVIEEPSREIIISAFLNDNIGESDLDRVRHYLSGRTTFSIVLESPGSAVVTEALYNNKLGENPFDDYFLRSKGGHGIRERLTATKERLKELIVKKLSRTNEVTIINFGSGPGRDVIDVIHELQNTEYGKALKAVCMDIDAASLEEGRQMAERMGVLDQVTFLEPEEGDFMFMGPEHDKRFDIGLLVGVLCPLENVTSAALIRKLRSTLKDGGSLISSNLSEKMEKDDPFTWFLMEKIGKWRLCSKSAEDMRWIYNANGFSNLEVFYDEPLRYNVIISGDHRIRR